MNTSDDQPLQVRYHEICRALGIDDHRNEAHFTPDSYPFLLGTPMQVSRQWVLNLDPDERDFGLAFFASLNTLIPKRRSQRRILLAFAAITTVVVVSRWSILIAVIGGLLLFAVSVGWTIKGLQRSDATVIASRRALGVYPNKASARSFFRKLLVSCGNEVQSDVDVAVAKYVGD